jgi:hypothetical protein
VLRGTRCVTRSRLAVGSMSGYSDSATVARTFDCPRNHALRAHKSRFEKGGGRETRKFW